MKVKSNYLVGVIMGSKSDWKGTMEHCSETLKQFVIKQGPDSKSLIVLDKICKEYEKKYFDFNKEIV